MLQFLLKLNRNNLKLKISTIVFLTAFIFIFGVYQINPSRLSGRASTDYKSYYYIVASNLVNGKGFYTNGKPAVFRPPGYSIYLASLILISNIIKTNYISIILILNFILYSLAVVLVYKVSFLLWSNSLSLLSAILWGTYPLFIFCALIFSSELLFTCMLVISVMLTLILFKQNKSDKKVYYVLAIILSILVLTRPIAVLFMVFNLFIVLRFCRNVGKQVKVLFVVMALLPIIIWSSWASMKTKRLVFISTAGLPAIYDGLTFAVNLNNYREPKHISPEIKAIMLSFQDGKSSKSFSNLIKLTFKNFESYPIEFLKLILWKIARSWYGTDSHHNENKIIWIQILFLIPGIAGLIRSFRLLYRPILLYLCGSIITFWVMTVVALSIVRYMTPISFILFLFVPAIFMSRQVNKKAFVLP